MADSLLLGTSRPSPRVLELPPGRPQGSPPASSPPTDAVPGLRILTAHDLLARRPDLPRTLRASGCVVRAVDDWQSLLEQVDHQAVDVVVVDLDAAQRVPQRSPAAISGYRLVALLAQRAARQRFTLAVQTVLDFSEIDDLMRQGVHLLLHPAIPDEDFARRILTVAPRGTAPRATSSRTAHPRQGDFLAGWAPHPPIAHEDAASTM